jgi:hypothetical protein
MKKSPTEVAHNRIKSFCTGLSAQTAHKQKSGTIKIPFMQDWVFRLGLFPSTIEFGWSLLMETSITLCMFVDGSFETFVQSGPTWILAQFYVQLVYKPHFGI